MSAQARKHRSSHERRLRFEACEPRRVLSAASLAAPTFELDVDATLRDADFFVTAGTGVVEFDSLPFDGATTGSVAPFTVTDGVLFSAVANGDELDVDTLNAFAADVWRSLEGLVTRGADDAAIDPTAASRGGYLAEVIGEAIDDRGRAGPDFVRLQPTGVDAAAVGGAIDLALLLTDSPAPHGESNAETARDAAFAIEAWSREIALTVAGPAAQTTAPRPERPHLDEVADGRATLAGDAASLEADSAASLAGVIEALSADSPPTEPIETPRASVEEPADGAPAASKSADTPAVSDQARLDDEDGSRSVAQRAGGWAGAGISMLLAASLVWATRSHHGGSIWKPLRAGRRRGGADSSDRDGDPRPRFGF